MCGLTPFEFSNLENNILAMSEAVAVSPGRETTEVSPSKNLSNVSINSPDKDAGQSKEATKDKGTSCSTVELRNSAVCVDEDQSEPQEDQSIQVTEKVEDPLTTSVCIYFQHVNTF